MGTKIKEGIKKTIIKTIILFLIFSVLILSISTIFSKTDFYQKNLITPKEFVQATSKINFNILLNAAMFAVCAFVALSYRRIKNIPVFEFRKYQLYYIIPAIILFFTHFWIKYYINNNLQKVLAHAMLWYTLRMIIGAMLFIILLLAIFGHKFVKYMYQKYKKEIIISAILLISFASLILLVQNLWTFFSTGISEIIYRIFRLFFNDVTYQPFVTSITMDGGGGPMLGINGFKAIIGKPCSGIDSFLLFTSLYALIFILDYKKLKKKLAITLFFVGALGMFITNILRILLLFIVGAYWSPKFAVGMFHTNAGWILFILYFFVFWYFASKHVYKK